jgi:hypothetical protein
MPSYPMAAEADARVAGLGEARAWKYPPELLSAGHMASFNLMVSMLVPYEWYGLGAGHNIYDPVSGSWVRFEREARQVVQGGPRRLWDEIEGRYEEWCRVGGPDRTRFGLTVSPDGGHTLWLDDPSSNHRWDVTPPARVTR